MICEVTVTLAFDLYLLTSKIKLVTSLSQSDMKGIPCGVLEMLHSHGQNRVL